MHIKTNGFITKARALQEGEVEFVVSTNALDAHGERINVEGIDFKSYKKNPVVLWGHDGFNLPIAKTTKIWREAGKLMARAKFKINDAFPRQVYEYIRDGYLNAVSIGGMVEEWAEDGITINKMQMMEFSVVSIPANQEALVANKSLDGDKRAELRSMANRYAIKILDREGNNGLLKQIDTLKDMVATLEELAISEPEDVQANQNSKVVLLRSAQAVDKHNEQIIKNIKVTLKGDNL